MDTLNSLVDDLCSSGFHIIDGFLDPMHCKALREIVLKKQQEGFFKPGKIGRKQDATHNESIRQDHIVWLDRQEDNPAIHAYFAKIEALCNTLNQSLFLGLVDYEAHFAIYRAQSYYKKHVDQFSTTRDRRVSCVYYLNEEWRHEWGGHLSLYDQNDGVLSQIQPLNNRFVCFNSNIPHEVCVTYQTRYSIAAWLKTRPMHLII